MASAEPPAEAARRLRARPEPTGDRPQRRPPTFGPEPAADIAGQSWCWWDLWAAAIAVVDHHGDLDALTTATAARIESLHGGRLAERIWAHLVDLGERVDAAGIDAASLVTDEQLADKRFMARARDKLDGRTDDYRALTARMQQTPRERLAHAARYGGWAEWPVSPAVYYEQLGGGTNAFVSKGQSFGAASRFETAVTKAAKRARTAAERAALGRAAHVVAWELADRADDSYGCIGQMRAEAWERYVQIDPAEAGIEPLRWWQDIAGLVVFDNFALTYGAEDLHWQRLPPALADDITSWLRALAGDLAAVHARWEADEAIAQIALLTELVFQ